MPKVAAGSVTGYYYIPVAGLPWQTSWQRLKDFARNQQPDGSYIDIDHAYVYPDTTDGWVRVKGKQNFRQALAHLDGGVLDHKSIMAFDRNEKEEVMLRDPALTTTHIPRRHRGSSGACDPFVNSSSGNDHFASPSISSYTPSDVSTDSYYPNSISSPTFSPPTPYSSIYYSQQSPIFERPATFDYAPNPNIVYAGNMAPATPVYVQNPQPVITYMVPVSVPYTDHHPAATYAPVPDLTTVSTPTPAAQTQNPNPNAPPALLIPTSARKIIITRLPHTTTTAELHSLMLKTITKCLPSSSYTQHSSNTKQASPIHNLAIQRHSNQKLRGHAFAVLESYEVAKVLVEKLDGYRWQGRELKVKFTKEGVEEQRGVPLVTDGNANKGPSKAEVKETRDHSRDHGHGSKGKDGKDRERHGERHVPVAPERGRSTQEEIGEKGLRLRTKSCEPGRRSSALHHGTPLVVDGSSHRR